RKTFRSCDMRHSLVCADRGSLPMRGIDLPLKWPCPVEPPTFTPPRTAGFFFTLRRARLLLNTAIGWTRESIHLSARAPTFNRRINKEWGARSLAPAAPTSPAAPGSPPTAPLRIGGRRGRGQEGARYANYAERIRPNVAKRPDNDQGYDRQAANQTVSRGAQ